MGWRDSHRARAIRRTAEDTQRQLRCSKGNARMSLFGASTSSPYIPGGIGMHHVRCHAVICSGNSTTLKLGPLNEAAGRLPET